MFGTIIQFAPSFGCWTEGPRFDAKILWSREDFVMDLMVLDHAGARSSNNQSSAAGLNSRYEMFVEKCCIRGHWN